MNVSTLRLYASALVAGIMFFALVGCAGRTSIFPNSDPALRKTVAQFAADAAKRFPYKADATRAGEAVARADVSYTLDTLRILNRSDETWENVEIWINQNYVVFVPKIEAGGLRSLPFHMLFNDKGEAFPTDNRKWLINSVDLYRDGKMYTVKTVLAD